MDAVAVELPPHAQEYRRQSRRLRARFHNDSTRLYRQLQLLSRQSDAQLAAQPVEPEADPVERFTQQVTRSLAGPILPYSQRLALLEQADRQGIERFEANLLIAAVQHRVTCLTIVTRTPRRWPPLVGQMLFFGLIQSVILAGTWWMIWS